ncbi:hypothetical protein MCANPG14_01901 [Mycoplasmopsis canis PG 14]|uniref:Uncharacterized protein n=1 Tax=Mycoplasmopsis canis TaxID=29555 RepID=A0A449ARH6_9BACT|nr:hypothetical protein [Mycoplasmopsis canis]AMD81143.1 hypothetical protein AXW82_01020 [Mycoplasmopsis canis PG 14]EIE39792.1 hypothetical protein MCANPG14_01901 [Mycoplasmopsis canis PG 14]VEU68966.1 Uncharacterised protein [Mycoplasmopsis canis]
MFNKPVYQKNILEKIFFILLGLSSLGMLLLSDKVIQWKFFLDTNWELSITWRIISSFIFTTIFSLLALFLVLTNNLRLIYLQIVAFIIAIVITVFWIPTYVIDSSSSSNEKILKWTWYKYDIIPVFVIYLIFYALTKAFSKEIYINKVRKLISKKP